MRRLFRILPLLGALLSCKADAPAAGPASGSSLAREETPCQLTGPTLSVPVGDGVMQALCDEVFVEPGLDAAARQALLAAHRTARQNLRRVFGGELLGPPALVFFCRSAACKVAFGASPAAAASRDLGFARDGVEFSGGWLRHPVVFVTGPEEGTARILTHELVHAEMKAWLPYDSLPTWFNEGMATFLAGEPICTPQEPADPAFDVRELDSKQAWQAHLAATGRSRETYCLARHEVSLWAARFEGDPRATAAALRAVLSSVADGGPFDRAFAR